MVMEQKNVDKQPELDSRPKSNGVRMNEGNINASMRVDVYGSDESEYGPSDELLTKPESENEGRARYPTFNGSKDMDNPILKVGMLFRNREEFKEACRRHGIKNRFQIYFYKNYFEKVQARCFNKGCGWKVFASKLDQKAKNDITFQTKHFASKHTCAKAFKNFHLTATRLVICT
ncbi:hypothetical protein JCGZ_01634 [Jatropha curcas]|uniref:Transposase MuDR plant domain-containing protein n=1 Tax=Jatropha curcas TaxID=180498 RepID=A0A067LCU4_JATCU|nr:hypothetical protein JCGZ_01634 [Jatropha curcas]